MEDCNSWVKVVTPRPQPCSLVPMELSRALPVNQIAEIAQVRTVKKKKCSCSLRTLILNFNQIVVMIVYTAVP